MKWHSSHRTLTLILFLTCVCSHASPRSATGVPSRTTAQPRQSVSILQTPLPQPETQFDDKELEEIRRYEDFTTIGIIPLKPLLREIDWVQDAARERYRRRQNLRDRRKRRKAQRYIDRLYDAGQPYIVITLIGMYLHSRIPQIPQEAPEGKREL